MGSIGLQIHSCESVFFLLQLSAVEKLKKCELRPSTKMSTQEAVDVLGCMFGKSFREYRDVIRFINSKKSGIEIKEVPICSSNAKESYKLFVNQYRTILHISSKEASTNWVLGDWLGQVSAVMNSKYSNWVFRTDPEFSVLDGKTYAADGVLVADDKAGEDEAVLVADDEVDEAGEDEAALLPAAIQAVSLQTSTVIPALVTECKPRVSANLASQEPFHITETLIQAFYLRRKHDFPILHCLTDLTEYHFFLIESAPGQKLKLSKYFHLSCDLRKETELANLLSFLYDVIELPISLTSGPV